MIVMSKTKIVGIGREGIEYLEKFSARTSFDVTAISISSYSFELEKCTSEIKIHIAKNETLGLDGESPQRSEKFAFKHYDEIFNALSGAELVINLAQIGGDDGGGVTPLVSYLAKDIGAISVTVACIPFTFEGLRRKKIALDSLIKLDSAADNLVVIESDYIIYSCNPKTLVSDALELVNDWVAETVNNILKCYRQLREQKILN